MLRILRDMLKFEQLLKPQTVSASTSSSGANVADFGSLTFVVAVGGDMAFDANNKLAITVQHSDVDIDGSYSNCADTDIYDAEDGANGIAKNLDSTDDDNTLHLVHYRGNKKFARIRLVETGTVSVAAAVLAVKGHSELQPAL